MPFDGSKLIIDDYLAILRTARRNIAKPGKWAKGDPDTWADDANCIVGWIALSSPGKAYAASRGIWKPIGW
jgi:hypothetical protein